MCDLFDDLLSFRKREDEKCQKKTTKKAAIRQPFLFLLYAIWRDTKQRSVSN